LLNFQLANSPSGKISLAGTLGLINTASAALSRLRAGGEEMAAVPLHGNGAIVIEKVDRGVVEYWLAGNL